MANPNDKCQCKNDLYTGIAYVFLLHKIKSSCLSHQALCLITFHFHVIEFDIRGGI